MVEAQHRLLTEQLGMDHLRLVMGTSMGGMHTWMWGEMHPDFMDALVPLACQPTAISGRNWLWRRCHRRDPHRSRLERRQLREAPDALGLFGADRRAHDRAARSQFQQVAPTRTAMDELYARMVDAAEKLDANDLLYATEAVMDYDPSPRAGPDQGQAARHQLRRRPDQPARAGRGRAGDPAHPRRALRARSRRATGRTATSPTISPPPGSSTSPISCTSCRPPM